MARAFVIKYSGYTDLFVFNDEPGKLIETAVFDTNFRYSWARLSDGETLPDEFVLIDGDRLQIVGNDVLDESADNYAAIRRLGNDLYIKTENGRSKKTL